MSDRIANPETPSYYSFDRLVDFLNSALPFIKRLMQLAFEHGELSASLRQQLEAMPTRVSDHLDAILGHLRQLPQNVPINFVGIDQSTPGLIDVRRLVEHALDDQNPEMEFKYVVYTQAHDNFMQQYGELESPLLAMTWKEWRRFFGQSVDSVKSAAIILRSLALSIPIVGDMLVELVEAFENALEQDRKGKSEDRANDALLIVRRAFGKIARVLRLSRMPA